VIVTKTQVFNFIYAIVCAVAALGAETDTIPFLPEAWRHYVTAAAVVAMWLKSHWNLFINPNGTPATEPYTPERKQ